MKVINRIGFLLPAIRIEVLVEITALVQQADADEGQAEVAGGLEMIAGEDAEAAGIVGDALRQSEFRGEVGDAQFPGLGVRHREPAGGGEVLVQIRGRAVHLGQEGLVRGEFVEAFLIDAAQKQPRVMSALLPQVGIEHAEEFDGGVMPGPSQVQRELVQALEARRQAGADVIGVNFGHRFHLYGPWQMTCSRTYFGYANPILASPPAARSNSIV